MSAPVIWMALARSGEIVVDGGNACVSTGKTALTEANCWIVPISEALASIETPFHSDLKRYRSLYLTPSDFASLRKAAPSPSSCWSELPSARAPLGNSTNQYFGDSFVICPFSSEGVWLAGKTCSTPLPADAELTMTTATAASAVSVRPRNLSRFISLSTPLLGCDENTSDPTSAAGAWPPFG